MTGPVREPRIGPPSATWRELRQLAWGVVLVVPYVAIVCYGAAGLVGARAAFWIAVGLTCLTIVTFGMLVVFSLVVTGIDDRLQARLHRRRRGAPPSYDDMAPPTLNST